MPELSEKTQDPTLRKYAGEAKLLGFSNASTHAETQLDLINDWLAHADGHANKVKVEAAAPRQECNPESNAPIARAIQECALTDKPAQVKTSRGKNGKPSMESKHGTTIVASTKPAGSPRQAAVDSARQSVALSAPLYLSVHKVALRYDVSVATIWRWVKGGRFPKPRKIAGSMTRWAVPDLDAYDRALG